MNNNVLIKRHFNIVTAILVLLIMFIISLFAGRLFSIESIPSNIGLVEINERNTNIYYHNNSVDKLWYGTDKWSVKFELKDLGEEESFKAKEVKIYFPQEGGTCNIQIYSDTVQPLDSLLVSVENSNLTKGWNTFALNENDYLEGKEFWIVFEYETDKENRYVATSSIGGNNSYYWVPEQGNFPGYFANMKDNDIVSELMVNLAGELLIDGFDLELVEFNILGQVIPDGVLGLEVVIRNNSSKTIDEFIGIKVGLASPTGQDDINLVVPLNLVIGANEEQVMPLTQETIKLNRYPSQYILTVTLDAEADTFPQNNSIRKDFDTFLFRRNRLLLESFLDVNFPFIEELLNEQEGVVKDALKPIVSINYLFDKAGSLHFSKYTESQMKYYGIGGSAFTVIDGERRIEGYFADYVDELTNLIESSFRKNTFVQLPPNSIEKTIGSNDLTLQFKCSLTNSNNFVFPEHIEKLNLFFGIVEKGLDRFPGNVLLYLDKHAKDNLNLNFGETERLVWRVDLASLKTAQRVLSRETLSYFELVCWLQDSQSKECFLVEGFPLEEFQMFTKIEKTPDVRDLGPKMIVYPNPSSAKSPVYLKLSDPLRYKPISLAIYNIKGQMVKDLLQESVDRESVVVWDGRDDFGARVGSGVYLLKVDYVDTDNSMRSKYQRINFIR